MRTVRTGGWLLLAAAALSGCATVVPLSAASTNPAAQGSVKVTEGDNGNTVLLLKVDHLAPAEKIAPGATTYVVWVRPNEGDMHPQNVGALQLNKELEGELQTVTPLTRFEVMVTPEPSAAATMPSGPPQMTASVSRR